MANSLSLPGIHRNLSLQRCASYRDVRSSPLTASDLGRLNVSSERGRLSFTNGRAEQPLHILHQPLNTCQPGRASNATLW